MNMRPRLPGFGFALCAPLLLSTGCGAAGALKLGSSEAASAPGTPGMPPTSKARLAQAESGAMAEAAPAPAPAPPPMSPSDSADSASAAASPAEPGSTPVVAAPSREMLDIEANVMLQVANVKSSVKALHELAARTGGVVTAERVDSASQYGSAELTLRVPSRATQAVFDDLEKLGTVLNQTVTARDIGKEFFDANLRLSSLTATLLAFDKISS
jgi:hypothetical protein